MNIFAKGFFKIENTSGVPIKNVFSKGYISIKLIMGSAHPICTRKKRQRD